MSLAEAPGSIGDVIVKREQICQDHRLQLFRLPRRNPNGMQLGGVTEKLNGVTDGTPEKGRQGHTFTHIERASVATLCL